VLKQEVLAGYLCRGTCNSGEGIEKRYKLTFLAPEEDHTFNLKLLIFCVGLIALSYEMGEDVDVGC
jgi:hypothetical protein